MGATPSPYPLTRLPVGAYLLVFNVCHIFCRGNCYRILNETNAILKFENFASTCIFYRFLFAVARKWLLIVMLSENG